MMQTREEPKVGFAQIGEPEIQQLSRAERRRMAFEVNLRIALETEADLNLDTNGRTRLIHALGAAFQNTRHGIEARTGLSRTPWPFYLVLFAGATWRRRGPISSLISPFAEALLSRTHGVGVRFSPEQLAAIGRAIDKAEISRRHALDKRMVFKLPWLRVYFTLIGGRSRRVGVQATSPERRAPANPSVGAVIFVCIALWLAGLGMFMIGATVYGFVRLWGDEAARLAMTEFFMNMFGQ